jgi:hypothetical protein
MPYRHPDLHVGEGWKWLGRHCTAITPPRPANTEGPTGLTSDASGDVTHGLPNLNPSLMQVELRTTVTPSCTPGLISKREYHSELAQ